MRQQAARAQEDRHNLARQLGCPTSVDTETLLAQVAKDRALSAQ
jgi:hypothetical protein